MSQYLKKVVAVIDSNSTFASTLALLNNDVKALQNQFTTLTGLAPESLDTLSEIGSALSSLQNRVSTLEISPNPTSFNMPMCAPTSPVDGDMYFRQDYAETEDLCR